MTSPYQNITYFKGLNSLRFLAALLVLFQHGESMKLKNGFESSGGLSLFYNGGHAVTFFFVLSGFLITYYLMKERNKTQTVSIKKFYLKRIFRIFPLYFLVVFIGAVLIPFLIPKLGIDYEMTYTFGQVWYYYLLFWPCLVTFYYGHHLLEPLWSIGVEVMFYIIWAPLMKAVKRNIHLLALGIIAIRILLQLLPNWFEVSEFWQYIINTFSFEAMAIGALGAYFVFHNHRDFTTSKYFSEPIQIFVFVIFVIFLLFNRNIDNTIWRTVFSTPILSGLLIDLIALYIILAVSMANGLSWIENKVLSYFGEISYGVYMYHTIVISVVIVVLKKFTGSFHPMVINAVYYVLIIAGSLLVSHFSKKYFEDFFLSLLKKKHSK